MDVEPGPHLWNSRHTHVVLGSCGHGDGWVWLQKQHNRVNLLPPTGHPQRVRYARLLFLFKDTILKFDPNLIWILYELHCVISVCRYYVKLLCHIVIMQSTGTKPMKCS